MSAPNNPIQRDLESWDGIGDPPGIATIQAQPEYQSLPATDKIAALNQAQRMAANRVRTDNPQQYGGIIRDVERDFQEARQTEVENALASVAGVREVAVIGIPDSRWGERPLALLAVDPATFHESAAQQQIRSLVSQGLISKHALLTHFKQVECIAKTSVGKIDKKTLRSKHAGVHC